ncbi:glycerophosphodiester phosphodiesterase family protein [Streptomyces sp. KM273126]|uniref:glycerophosphodiester phosphodiesterase family protein n=1 Tax=Streptomyces sp. KM273126 TaxID=2545247 RepID=UPI00103CEC1A|nr:glycerophosphodiester phosphodiesterase family protein [Streptomyces sp. KM273126]MBA2805920.1 glycerophosphodiester phosphodiesterase family protein [Streptomyces sp. KM273126]
MFGHPRYQDINALLNTDLAQRTPLICVHRGTGLGNVPENTADAITAALRQGADMVEFDVIRSADGVFFVFHDGLEQHAFDRADDIRALGAEEIRALRYGWSDRAAGPSELGDVFARFRSETLFNVDRSWWYWDELLPFADRFDMAGQLVLKSPADDQWLDKLRRHPVKYPFVPMVHSRADLDAVLDYPDINLVGVELIARHAKDELADPAVIAEMHQRGLLCLLNAINLPDGVPLYAGIDDHTSVVGDPDDGWGRLMEMGADIIQTDWPDLLGRYRHRVRGTAVREYGTWGRPAPAQQRIG